MIKKTFLFLIALLMLSTTPTLTNAWYNDSWEAYREITFDHSLIDEDLSDFPVLVHLDSSNVNWSKVQDDLDDLRFIALDNVTVYSYEIDNYTLNDEAWIWVKIPTVSSSENTTFYMYYANPLASSGEDSENVWDSNYVFVGHLNDYPDSSHIKDSTTNDNDGTKAVANQPEAVNGLISDAQDFEKDTSDYVTIADSASLDVDAITIEFWVKLQTVGINQYVLAKIYDVDDEETYRIYIGTSNKIHLVIDDGSGWSEEVSTQTLTFNVWYHVVTTYALGSSEIYFNSTECGDDGISEIEAIANNNRDLLLGARYDGSEGGPKLFLDGTLDELRISNTVRSPAYVKATYYSGLDDLLSFGNEEILEVVEEAIDYGIIALGVGIVALVFALIGWRRYG
jgi:hypothetical protein